MNDFHPPSSFIPRVFQGFRVPNHNLSHVIKPNSYRGNNIKSRFKKTDKSTKMSNSNAQLHNVFVYGSFQEPEVINVMMDRTPEIVSATLPGFKRFRLKGRLYPCVVPSETGEVHGKILMGLTDAELENVDWVEGNQYERVTAEVIRKDNSEKLTVKTYLWVNKNDPDIEGEWNFEEWKRLHMKKFIESFKEIMEEKKNPQGKGRDSFNSALREDL